MVEGLPSRDPRITAFKGIPFAAPPTSDLRWKAPQPAANWNGVLKTHNFSAIPMQKKPGVGRNDIYAKEFYVDSEVPMSEDCLYLNIWTPAILPPLSASQLDEVHLTPPAGENLPVYVWYYGGAFQQGYTSEMEFDGERLARRGIVVVTINYRVNVFGFFSHPELTKENPDFPANFGNLDQTFATQWVKRNIAAFGGDPGNITIGGQSAGGGSVLTQLTSPLTKDLFQKAVIHSGTFYGAYQNRGRQSRSFQDAEKQGEEFFEFLGVKTLAEARTLPAETIRDKCSEFDKGWSPVVDGNYITGNSGEMMLKNQRHPVPLLMGFTSDEFASSPNAASMEEIEKLASERFGERAKEFLEICKRMASNSPDIEAINKVATINPMEIAIRAYSKKTAELQATAPENYFYIFGGPIPGEDNPGAFHSSDLWFFFETLALSWRPFSGLHYDLARQMCNYLANFIKCGNPNGSASKLAEDSAGSYSAGLEAVSSGDSSSETGGQTLPEWKPFSDGEKPMVFKGKSAMSTEEPSELINFLVNEALSKI